MTYLDVIILKHGEGWNAVQIHSYLIEVFQDKAPAYSTVTKKLRMMHFNQPIDDQKNSEDIRTYSQNINKVKCCIENHPNSSIRDITEMTEVPATSIYRYLTQYLNYINCNLRWIPHQLTTELKQIRIETSKQLLATIEKAEKNNFHFFLTGDESWFSYNFEPTTQWIKKGMKPDKRVRKSLNCQKVMITIFWNIDQIHVLDCLTTQQRMNSQYFIERILNEILESEPFVKSKKQKTIILHSFR